MKKILAVLLSVMTLVGVFGIMASAGEPKPNPYCTCTVESCPDCINSGCRVVWAHCDCPNNEYVPPAPGSGFANAIAKLFTTIDNLFLKLGFYDVEGYGKSDFFTLLDNLFEQIFGYGIYAPVVEDAAP